MTKKFCQSRSERRTPEIEAVEVGALTHNPDFRCVRSRATVRTARHANAQRLTAQAGRDLVRYTQEGGRVTLPVTISGSVGAYSVGIDLADLTRRAIINRTTEEVQDAIKKGLGGLLGR